MLYGIAGSGKSAIAQSLSELCVKDNILAASYFFDRREKEGCRTERIAPTIAYQLALSIPALKQPICNALNQDMTILDTDFKNQLHKLIVEPLKSLSGPDLPLLVVIDAIDEWNYEDRVHVVQLLALATSIQGRPPFRFLITSRPETRIKAIFKDPKIHHATLRVDLEDFSPDADIRLFLQRRLSDIRRARDHIMTEIPSPWPSNEQMNSLVAKSSGLFIYASTSVKFIEDERASPQDQLEIILNDNPGQSDLDRLYSQVLSSSCDPDELRSVIGAIILLRIPLSLRELGCLLGIPVGRLQLVLENLHSILSIPANPDTGPVTTWHLSLHDFLTCSSRAGIYYIDPSLKHADLTKLCLMRIATLPKPPPRICRHLDPIQCRSAIKDYFETSLISERIATKYACWYWSSHLAESSETRTDLLADMVRFSKYCIIPWSIVLLGVEPSMAREQDWDREREARQRESQEVWEIREKQSLDIFEERLRQLANLERCIFTSNPAIKASYKWLVDEREMLYYMVVTFLAMPWVIEVILISVTLPLMSLILVAILEGLPVPLVTTPLSPPKGLQPDVRRSALQAGAWIDVRISFLARGSAYVIVFLQRMYIWWRFVFYSQLETTRRLGEKLIEKEQVARSDR
jgi:hypothetical protein